ncbi:MAG: Wzz/FepE/Etk N-terminal domain-containing protein [Deltaproteobacteria bacterium]|nr:Wzz/FepE/Etk N-terminal domain-containing protein [Deltaproteobacteria bacterium]
MKEEPTRSKTEETASACPSPVIAQGTPGQSPPWSPGHGAYSDLPEEEDEINLLDLFIVLLKHKVMIFSVVLLAGIMAVVISIQMPNIYRSEITISPTTQEKTGGALSALGGFASMIASDMGIGGTGSLDQFEVVLKSRDLTNGIVIKYDLLPILFEKSWDAENKRWKVGKPSALQNLIEFVRGMLGVTPEKKPGGKDPFTLEDARLAMQGLLKITPNKKQNVMQLSIEHKDPVLAQTILNYYVVGLSEFLRQQTLTDAAAQQAQLGTQLAKTTDPMLKNRLYEVIAKQIEKEALATVQRYYSFNIIDPAFVPEKKFKPKRAQICLLSVVVAFFIAIFLAFFLEYLNNMKRNEDPERLANLRNALRFRRRA